MIQTKNKMPWVKIIDKLKSPTTDKQTLFQTLHEAVGEQAKLRDLGLPTIAAVVSLKSFEAIKRADTYTKHVSKVLPQISKIANKSKKREILDMLNKMAPQKFDYAVIGLNTYLKMDKTHTIDGFYKEYDKYTAEHQKTQTVSPSILTKLQENRLHI